MKTLNIEQRFHYDKDDEECGGDYYNMDLVIDGKHVKGFADEYHENPRAQMEGFFFALDWLQIPYGKSETHTNDSEY